MPQIDQLTQIFGSQLFWLLVVFGTIFFLVARGMLPRIQSVVIEREARIAEDEELAEAARAAASEAEAMCRAREDGARAEASSIAREALRKGAREHDRKCSAAMEAIDRKTDNAIQRIRDSVAAAREEMDTVATEAARDIVERLVGIKVERAEAARAVAAELRRPDRLVQRRPAAIEPNQQSPAMRKKA